MSLASLHRISALGRLGRSASLCLRRESTSVEAEKENASDPRGRRRRELWRVDPHNRFQEIPEAWVESLDSIKGRRVDLVQLHPDVWRTSPRLDLVYANLMWQKRYRNVTFLKALSRAELPGSGKKLYPQNAGLGKSRQKSIRSPLWIEGGIAHGCRGPKTDFYMLPQRARVAGLTTALTLKHAQDDLVVLDSFAALPKSKAPKAALKAAMDKMDTTIWKVSEARNWGYSCLFVDVGDVTPRELGLQCARVEGFTPMPLYGLNVFSILKHETLVITTAALALLEDRLLSQLHKLGPKSTPFRYMDEKDKLLSEFESEQEHFARKLARRQLLEADADFESLDEARQKELVRLKAREWLDNRPPPFV